MAKSIHQTSCRFFFFFIFYNVFLVSRYEKLRAVLAMETTNP